MATAQGSNLDGSLSYASWSVDGVLGGNSSVGTIVGSGASVTYAPPASEATQTVHSVTVKATDGTSTGTGTISVTVNPAGVAPSAKAVAPNIPVDLGTSQKLVLQITGNPTAVTCSSTLFGQLVVAADFSTVTYAPPATVTPPASASDSISCPASNGNGQGTVTPTTVNLALVTTLNSPVAVTPAGTLYLPSTPSLDLNILLTGSGFQTNCTLAMGPNVNLLNPSISSWSQIVVNIAVDSSHDDPGFKSVSMACPYGGGETSNTAIFGFLGIMNQEVLNSTDFSLLDQQTGLVRKYLITNGSADGTINVLNGIGSIAEDDTNANDTGYLVAAESNGSILAYVPATGARAPIASVLPNGPVSSVAAKGHYVVFAEDTLNMVGLFDLTQVNPTATYQAVAANPWNAAMTTLGAQLTAVIFSSQGDILTTLSVPSLSTTGTVNLTNLTPAGSVPAGFGGTQLVTFDSGPGVGTAWVLSTYDNVVDLVSLTSSPLRVTKEVTLTGVTPGTAFRIAGNLADGSVVVAIADPTDAITKLVKVSPSGTVTPLASTNAFSFLATGLGVSTDGTKIYGANRSQSEIVANQ